MLWLVLATLIATDPATLPAASANAQALGPMTTLSAQPRPEAPARAPAFQPLKLPEPSVCNSGIQQINGRLEDRPAPVGDGRVRLYRLFALNDAWGCPIPVIARDLVPEADQAIGRVIR